ncbi:protein-cysteine N-palmitoyltransferase Rasp [Rhynchophorus ferrugineus]|uniref:protein-cysteine N-palmitoyltransferase Rasp n=1 Tax=Rhynchophorus ferrugineus TaxID=354439 RepID=UPI003FCE5803
MTTSVRLESKEVQICLIIWISTVLYCIYNFFIISQKYFLNFHDSFDDFVEGWGLFGSRKRDKADFEWETITFLVQNLSPYFLVYVGTNEFLRYKNVTQKNIQFIQIIFSLTLVYVVASYKGLVLISIQPILFFLVGFINSTLCIWLCNFLCLSLIVIYKTMVSSDDFLNNLNINHYEAYITILLLCWLNLKCTSYFLSSSHDRNVLVFLSYCLYCPTLFTGPFIPFDDFKETIFVWSYESFYLRAGRLLKSITRCIFWYIFGNMVLHFVYVNATGFQLQLVSVLDMWSLCGYGYLMGQLFHIKYVVLYGLSTSLTSFENIKVPHLPRCIGRVHLYSDMWKYFDPGLHTFLKGCIFIPCYSKTHNKFLSSFLCFLFVYVWHGIEDYILIWAVMNYSGVCLESLARYLYMNKLKTCKFWQRLQKDNLDRMQCVLAAPLLSMSAISNFYFFAGKDVGDIFWNKALGSGWMCQLAIFSILYCCCRISNKLRHIQAHMM